MGTSASSSGGSREGLTIARMYGALPVKDAPTVSGGMQGLKDVSSKLVQDALQELTEAVIAARLDAGCQERTGDPGGGFEVNPNAGERHLLPGSARATPLGRPDYVGSKYNRLRHGHADAGAVGWVLS